MKTPLHSITHHSALGDGQTDCTAALQRAIDQAAKTAPGEVRIPAGVWLSGTLYLRAGITLYLEEGAVLRASGDLPFPFIRHPMISRMDLFPWRAFLFGYGLADITLAGEGTIECGGQHPRFQDGIGDSPDRPYGIHLVNCRNVRIEGLRLRNSAHWMLRLLKCRDVRVRGLDVFNHCNKNNDGMDIDSCNGVRVSDCTIDSSDDALCLKSETNEACRNVVVSNCRLSSHASAIKLGTASIGGFEDVVISDCTIRPSRADSVHHPFNLPKGMSGIDIACVDGGTCRNLRFHRISMEGVLNPFFVKLGQRYSTGTIPKNRQAGDGGARPGTPGKGCLENLVFSEITAVGAGPIASMLFGSEGHAISDVTLRDVQIESSAPETDQRPEPDWSPTGYPCAVSVAGKDATPVFGFHFRHINRLVLENVRVTAAPGETRNGLDCEAVEGMETTGFDCQKGG